MSTRKGYDHSNRVPGGLSSDIGPDHLGRAPTITAELASKLWDKSLAQRAWSSRHVQGGDLRASTDPLPQLCTEQYPNITAWGPIL